MTPAPGPDLTRTLLDFMGDVSSCADESEAAALAVARAAHALGAELCVLLRGQVVLAAVGLPSGSRAESELRRAAGRALHRVELPELGPLRVASAPVSDAGSETGGTLIVGRRAQLRGEETELLSGMARALGMALRTLRTLQHERELRLSGEREASQRRRIEHELEHQALHDELTGLPNRSLLLDRAAQAIERASSSGDRVAALAVDIDNFALANESLGRRGGDELLRALARRLEETITDGHGHTLARLDADEFVILCEELDSERDAVTVADGVRESLRRPFTIDGRQTVLSASIGIAVADPEPASTLSPGVAEDLLGDADVALARAKQGGGDRYEIFDAQMRVRLLDRARMEDELRAALSRAELTLHYQPVVAVGDGRLTAVEALVRWQHPTRGLLGPAQFIPLAEEGELIVQLGAWVIEEACRQIRQWREAHPAKLGVRVSVNVSTRQLTPQLLDTVRGALDSSQVDPSQLALEITETLLMEEPERSLEILAELRRLGVSIVLDDFGTGYSSLSYLRRFPLDQLKLDRSFMSELEADPRVGKIIAATIEMGRALGMTVVAEGVETAGQLEVLHRLGCDYAQGYHFASPGPPDIVFDHVLAAYDRDSQLVERPASVPAPLAGTGLEEQVERARTARDQAMVGRMATFLFAVGSLLAIPADLVMRAPGPPVVILLTLMGLGSAAVCRRVRWASVSPAWLHALTLAATIEVTISVVAVGSHASVLSAFYLLVAMVAAYGLRSRRAVAVQVIVIAAAMSIPLFTSDRNDPDAASGLIVSFLVLSVMAAVVVWLRERVSAGYAELRTLADRDPLTEVGNYRLLHERLEYELLRHARDEEELAILLIDLDRFKQVNERLGHAAGDDVLRRVAGTLRDAVRDQDTVARQGGDEFAVLAPATDRQGAAMLAARVRDRLGRVQFAGDSISATVGVAVYPADGVTAQALLARADSELLATKSSDRVSGRVAGALGDPAPRPAPSRALSARATG